ncbi:MAG: hypothetical protein AAF366_03240 [Pseudomonadota bacterium]
MTLASGDSWVRPCSRAGHFVAMLWQRERLDTHQLKLPLDLAPATGHPFQA